MKKLLLSLVLSAGVSLGDPAPLGLELGKATVKDAKERYSLTEDGINRYSLGPMFEVHTDQTGIDDLLEATLIFDKEGKLTAVMMVFPKGAWDKVYRTLKRKYELVESQIPFVGNRYAKFKDGNSVIIVDAPHLSFTMTVLYARQEFLDAYHRIKEEERRKARERLERGL